ncbi:wings apart-like protein regulation of heterochromatin-domain-containing protein [Dipodascopsis uninucleata]
MPFAASSTPTTYGRKRQTPHTTPSPADIPSPVKKRYQSRLETPTHSTQDRLDFRKEDEALSARGNGDGLLSNAEDDGLELLATGDKESEESKAHSLSQLKRPATPPALDGIEFVEPDPPSTPLHFISSGDRSHKFSLSPRLSVREKEAWRLLSDAMDAAGTGSPLASPEKSGQKLISRLTSRKRDPDQPRSIVIQSEALLEQRADSSFPIDQNIGSQPNQEHNDLTSVGGSQQYSSQIVRTGKVTYGSQRSFLEDSIDLKSDIDDLRVRSRPRSLLEDNTNQCDDDDDDSQMAVKSIHELRASGSNAKFMDEMEYMLDGLKPRAKLSASRLTLLELAIKLTDKSFRIKFKAGDFLDRVFATIGRFTDEISTFCLAYIICAFIDDDEGIAQGLLTDYNVVPFLIAIADDSRDIVQVSKMKAMGLSKISQSMVKELCDKILKMIPEGADTRPESVTRSLLALTAILDLSSKYMQRYPVVKAKLNDSNVCSKVLSILEARVSSKPTEYHEIHMAVSILEDAVDNNIDEVQACKVILSLIDLIPPILDTQVESVGLSFIRFAILITNSSLSACELLCTRLALTHLLDFVERVTGESEVAASEDTENYGLSANLAIFSLGLLVNMCEAEKVAKYILDDKSLIERVSALFYSAYNTQLASSSPLKYMRDLSGYLALLTGLLAKDVPSGERTRIGSSFMLAAVGSTLEQFKEDTVRMQDEIGLTGGRGLADHISSVLTALYAVT